MQGVAVKRGKSQARRNGGHGAGLPGWAWMVLGIVLTIAVVLLAPKYLKSDGSDGFFRPRPNPDAQPVATPGSEDDEAAVPEDSGVDATTPASRPTAAAGEPEYDFYTLLPGEEVAMTDAQLAAAAREEEARQGRARQQQENQTQVAPPATTATTTAAIDPAGAATATPPPVAATTATSATPAGGNDTPYILQAGAFGASGDAEAVKARIALLGLNARVESARINGKTVYRVRMGPYGTASELAAAKAKLASGGLPAMAIRAR